MRFKSILMATSVLCATATAQQISSVINSTSGQSDHFAPGAAVVIVGEALSDTSGSSPTDALRTDIPLRDGSTFTYYLGRTKLSLLSWSPTRVSVFFPADLVPGSRLPLRIERTLVSGATSNYILRGGIRIRSQAPALIVTTFECAIWQNNTCADLHRIPRAVLTDSSGSIVSRANPIVTGGSYTVWATGLGKSTVRNGVRVSESAPDLVITRVRESPSGVEVDSPVQEVKANVLFAGNNSPGLDQINFLMPRFPVIGCTPGAVIEGRLHVRPVTAGVGVDPAASNVAFAPVRLSQADCEAEIAQ